MKTPPPGPPYADARRALVLGIEAFSRIALGGFQALMLLDPEGCRNFAAELTSQLDARLAKEAGE